jgi:hypothetical protein
MQNEARRTRKAIELAGADDELAQYLRHHRARC